MSSKTKYFSVQIGKLPADGANWLCWKSRMLTILGSSYLSKYIQGPKVPLPGDDMRTSSSLRTRKSNASKTPRMRESCQGWILNSIANELLLKMKDLPSAKVWDAGCNEFESQKSIIRRRRCMHHSECEGVADVRKHLAELLTMHEVSRHGCCYARRKGLSSRHAQRISDRS